MAKYELSDAQVDRLIELLKETGGKMDANPGELIDTLQTQIPPDAPTGLCAVVQDEDGTLWVRVDDDPEDEDEEPLNWRASGDSNSGAEWVSAEDLPRPFTVLFEGVDL